MSVGTTNSSKNAIELETFNETKGLKSLNRCTKIPSLHLAVSSTDRLAWYDGQTSSDLLPTKQRVKREIFQQ